MLELNNETITVIPEPDRRAGDRRAGDRRTGSRDKAGEDKRAELERRMPNDRRGLYAAVKYTSPGALTQLRIWLGENCGGDWSIAVDDADSIKSWGKFRVRFEQARDLDNFVSTIAA